MSTTPAPVPETAPAPPETGPGTDISPAPTDDPPASRVVDPSETPVLSRWQVAIAAVLLGVVAAHVAATFLWVQPATPVRNALAGPLTSYMTPMFQQNWSLFAPNPVQDQYLLEVRGVRADLSTTPWLTPSADELAGLRRSVLPGRDVRLTAELSRSASQAVGALPDAARGYVGWSYHHDAPTRLRDAMAATDGGTVTPAMRTALDYDEVLTAYATQYVLARAPQEVVAYVQYRIVRQTATGYYGEDRGTTTREVTVASGRRPLTTVAGQDAAGFAAHVRGRTAQDAGKAPGTTGGTR